MLTKNRTVVIIVDDDCFSNINIIMNINNRLLHNVRRPGNM